jgi:hypothetical protein
VLFIPLCFRSFLHTNSGGCGGRFDYKNTSPQGYKKNEHLHTRTFACARVHSRVNTKRSQIGIIALFAPGRHNYLWETRHLVGCR